MQLLADTSLKPYNTFGLDIPAKSLMVLTDTRQLAELASLPEPLLVLGGGSNVLFSEPYQGTVVLNRLKGIRVVEDEAGYHLHVAAGESWPELVDWTLAQNMPGLENLALIPGTVGAAPIQNIGAYGVELSAICRYVEYFDRLSGETHRLPSELCAFGYRHSIFKAELKDRALITAVGFHLPRNWLPVLSYAPLNSLSSPSPMEVAELVKATRRSKLPDPAQWGNAGSFFKNPTLSSDAYQQLQQQFADIPGHRVPGQGVKVPAAWLIDQLGWKGKCQDGAAVHHLQPLVLINKSVSSPAALLSLARAVRASVKRNFRITLEPEVRLLGSYGEIAL